MIITEQQLKQIIKEEVQTGLAERTSDQALLNHELYWMLYVQRMDLDRILSNVGLNILDFNQFVRDIMSSKGVKTGGPANNEIMSKAAAASRAHEKRKKK